MPRAAYLIHDDVWRKTGVKGRDREHKRWEHARAAGRAHGGMLKLVRAVLVVLRIGLFRLGQLGLPLPRLVFLNRSHVGLSENRKAVFRTSCEDRGQFQSK